MTVSAGAAGVCPVPDMAIEQIANFELAEYERFADFYRANWGRIDPVLAGIQKTSLPDNREQVVVDVLMTPFAPAHFDLLRKYAGPADSQRIAPIPGDLAAIRLSPDQSASIRRTEGFRAAPEHRLHTVFAIRPPA